MVRWIRVVAILVLAAGLARAEEYDRSKFYWISHDCLDTRERVPIRDAIEVKLSDDGCRVLSGKWRDWYSGEIYEGPSRGLDIDHVLAFHHAWGLGLSEKPYDVQLRYYNDMDGLVAVTASENRSKSDQSLCTWRPTVPTALCEVGLVTLRQAAKYGLDLPDCERSAAIIMLQTCPVKWDLSQ